LTTEPPKIQLLVVQPTPFCNIDCRYCYLPDRSSKAVVSVETLGNLFSQIFSSGWARDHLSVIWHAGEPLVMPVRFYRDAFGMIDRLKPDGLQVTHSFQTNGTLLDDEWCEFLRGEQVNFGVSIDGPQRFHDRNRRTRSGRGTFDKTIAGIRLLRRHGARFHVISVLSRASMAVPREMFDFYLEEGIEQVCFNIEESEGDHVSEVLGARDVENAYYRFLSEFWRLSAAHPGRITFIREIEHALKMVLRPKEAEFYNELAEMAASPVLTKMKQDIDAGVALCRQHCQYFSVCGGGEPVNKLAENGSFVSTETAYCRVMKMRGTDLVLDAIERASVPGSQASDAVVGEQLSQALHLPAE